MSGTDSHLVALPASVLTAAAIRSRFARAGVWHAELPGDGQPRGGAEEPGSDAVAVASLDRSTRREPAHAAVLVPLVQRDNGLNVLLTRRSEQLRDHAGQISFPGGRAEPEDAGPAATALREALEEVGLAPRHVEVIGLMPIYTTVTHFVVTPVVALVQPPFDLALDASEVAEAFEVPLDYLMNPAHHRRHVVTFDGGQRQFLSMPWHGPDAAGGAEREFYIWGATAAMLRNLFRFLSD